MKGQNDLLESFIRVSPYLNDLTLGDCAVAVCDTEKHLAYFPGRTIDHKIRPGQPVARGSVVAAALTSGQRVIRRVGREVYGFPYIGIGIPVLGESGQLIGAVSLNENIDKQDNLLQMADKLFRATAEVTQAAEKVSFQAEGVAEVGRFLKSLGLELGERVLATDSVIRVMQKITSQTNLLGLNASIEAARVGAKGSGFGIVAAEIRRLAESSIKSLKEVEVILGTLNASNKSMEGEIERLAGISSEQAAAVQTATAAIAEVNDLARALLEYAESLWK